MRIDRRLKWNHYVFTRSQPLSPKAFLPPSHSSLDKGNRKNQIFLPIVTIYLSWKSYYSADFNKAEERMDSATTPPAGCLPR